MAFVHHTVNANDYSPEDSAGIVLGIAKYHRDHNGWNDIGYNFLVDRYGQIFEGRGGGIDQPVIGAQAEGWNRLSTGVANLGTFSDVPQTPEAIDAIARLLGWKMTLHGIPCEGTVVLTSGGGARNRYSYGTRSRCSASAATATAARPSARATRCTPSCRTSATRSSAHAGALPAALRITCVPQDTQVAYGQDATSPASPTNSDGIARRRRSASVCRRSARADRGRRSPHDHRRRRLVERRATVGSERAVFARRSPALRRRRSSSRSSRVLQARAQARRVQAGGLVAISGSARPAGSINVLVERKGRSGRWSRVGTVRARVRRQRFRTNIRLRNAGPLSAHAVDRQHRRARALRPRRPQRAGRPAAQRRHGGLAPYSPVGWRTTKPSVERSAGCQRVPARLLAARVEAHPGHGHERVVGVRVDRDPLRPARRRRRSRASWSRRVWSSRPAPCSA